MSSSAVKNIWVGGYTDDMGGSAQGIGLIRRAADGTLDFAGLAAGIDSPSFLARGGDLIYATGEGNDTVSAFRERDGELLFLGSQGTAGGTPCSIGITTDLRFAIVACYADGAVGVHPLAPNGSLHRTAQSLDDSGHGPHEAQDRPHAHAAVQVDDSTVLTADLGTDRVHVHRLAADGLVRTSAVQFPPGSGPRDIVAHPSGKVLVLAELSGEVFLLARSGDAFSITGKAPLPGAVAGNHSAGLVLAPDGRRAYACVRGSDLVSSVDIGAEGISPGLSVSSEGSWPRHLAMDDRFLHVANQFSNSVSTFTIDDDGLPVFTASISVPSPTYLLVD